MQRYRFWGREILEVPEKITFRSEADPLFNTLGHAAVSHPEEYQSIIATLERNGVRIENSRDAITFSPNTAGGATGNVIYLPEKFPISALRHEYGHFLDHQLLDYPRYIEYFKNPKLIIRTECSQYLNEIRFARSLGDQKSRSILIQNYLKEHNCIIEKYYQEPYGCLPNKLPNFNGSY